MAGIQMKLYCIFDDYPEEACECLKHSGIEVDVHPYGLPRPDKNEMKSILENYDGAIIGTSQKISSDMFEHVESPRIIATASVGTDHIDIPVEKKDLVTVLNTPKANAKSVAEYTIGCALFCCKRLYEGRSLYYAGKNNKNLKKKPEDLYGKTIGVIGAGNISAEIMNMARMLGMNVLFWTPHPEKHLDLVQSGMKYTDIHCLCSEADVISVNLPNKPSTAGFISGQLVSEMKNDAVFISVSRLPTIDLTALKNKASQHPDFYLCLDIDVDDNVIKTIPDIPNILITPHIAGGTIETRKRMFHEIAVSIVDCIIDNPIKEKNVG